MLMGIPMGNQITIWWSSRTWLRRVSATIPITNPCSKTTTSCLLMEGNLSLMVHSLIGTSISNMRINSSHQATSNSSNRFIMIRPACIISRLVGMLALCINLRVKAVINRETHWQIRTKAWWVKLIQASPHLMTSITRWEIWYNPRLSLLALSYRLESLEVSKISWLSGSTSHLR